MQETQLVQAFLRGCLQYWDDHGPLTDYQQGVKKGLTVALEHINKHRSNNHEKN